ncbi:MAG: YggU family protein [Nitrospinae bacterium]|nr:YggU family protein [Nitrospinota bacterium]
MGREESIFFELKIRVQPGASKSEIVGMQEDRLKVRIKAPPVEGKANEECVVTLAKAFGLRKRDIEIVSGDKGRDKTIKLYGLEKGEGMRILSSLYSLKE